MEKVSNETAIAHVQALLGKAEMVKQAKLEMATGSEGDPVLVNPAGTETIDTSKEKTIKTEGPTSEGSFSGEKKGDLQDATDGTLTENMTENSNDHSTAAVSTDFNAEGIEVGANPETGQDRQVITNKTAEEVIMKEANRVQALGGAIKERLNKIAAQGYEVAGMDKLSAEESESLDMFKQAADAHYSEYVNAFAAGMLKRAEDVAAIMAAEGADEDTANAILDDVAAEDPELVVPSDEEEAGMGEMLEGGEGAEGELSHEDVAALEEIVDQLDAAGVTPEELAAAVEDIGEEDMSGVEKAASYRQTDLKDLVRSLRQ